MFLVEMKYKAFRRGLRVAEVPIIFVERKSGDSKLDGRHSVGSDLGSSEIKTQILSGDCSRVLQRGLIVLLLMAFAIFASRSVDAPRA